MPDKNLILKRSLQKIVKSAIKKDPILTDVYRVDITFLFKSPVMSAMCDWVYGVEVTTKSDNANQQEISGTISYSVTKTISMISKDTLCLTEINFESAY